MTDPSPEGARLKLLQAALDHINQGFTVFDSDLLLVGWNRRLFELLDFPYDLARNGTHFSEFMRMNAERGEYGDGDIDALVAERVGKARAFEPHYMERVRPNGEIIAVKGDPLPGGGFVATYTNITDQRLREEALEAAVAERTSALRESESRLRLITDAVPALIAYFDTRPCYTFANRRYAAWFGHTADDIIGRPLAEVLEEDLYRELEPMIRQALGGVETTYEYRRKGADGAYADKRTTLLPDIDEAGAVRGCFVLSLDITEQKQREAALHQAQKMEAVGQLTGGVAHDFNNLLTIILGNLMDIRAKTDQSSALAELTEPAIDAANRGASLINRLLAFARGHAVDPRPVDVAVTVGDLARLLRRSLPGSIEVVTQIKDAPRPTLVDRSRLENAVLNLALNARDAMEGRGRILFSVSETHVRAREAHDLGVAPGDYVRLDIEDTGPGMTDNVRRRAFEPFFTTKPFGAGNGLGLSTVYGFARQSSGTVRITSEPNAGARLSLYLPCLDTRIDESDSDPEMDIDTVTDLERRDGLVLLVEDDPGVRAVVRRQLMDLSFSVLEAEDTDEAFDMIRTVGEIRYLVSDVVVPGKANGIALAKQTRDIAPTIKIGLISGYTDAVEAAERGTCPFPILLKPFTAEALAGLMGRLA